MGFDRLFASMSTAEWILNFAFHSLLVLLMGWLFIRLLRRKSAPLRSKIIFVTMLALLLLPFFSVTYLSFDITFYKTSLPFAGDSRLSSTEIIDVKTSNVSVEHETPAGLYEESAASTEKSNEFRVFFQSILSGITTANVINGIGLIWLAGFILLLGRLLYGAASLRKFKKSLVRIQDVRLDKILRQAQKTFHFRSLPEVYASRSAKSPVVLGITRPLVVLPQKVYGKLNTKEIRSILYHELSHIYHKDQIMGVIQRIVTALYWWNPFVHTMSTDFSKAREEISDNHAIMGNNSREYAECLVNLAEKTALVNRLPFLQGLAVPHIPLRERICQILSKERIMATETKKTTTFIILIGFVLSLGLVAGYKWTFASEKIEMKTEMAQDTGTQIQEKKEQEKEKQKEKQKKAEEQSKKEGLAEAEELANVIELTLGKELANIIELNLGVELMMDEMVQTKKEVQEKEEELEMKIKEIMKILNKELSKISKVNVESIELQETTLSEEQKEEIRKLVKELMNKIKVIKAKAIPAVMLQAETLSDQEKEELRTKIMNLSVKIGKQLDQNIKRGIRVDLKRAYELDFKPNIRVDLKRAIEVNDEGKVVVKVKPVLVVKVQPEFPDEAKEKGIYGEVVVEGTTNKKGEVVKVKVLKGAHELLNEAVVTAVKQWKYELPEYKGKTYAITFVVTVRFNPEDKDGNSWTVSIDS
jgi:TonB family protein